MTAQKRPTVVLCAVVLGTITLFTNQTGAAANTDNPLADNVAPRILIRARFIEAPEDDVQTILKAGTVVDSGEKNTVEIITSNKMTSLIGQLASRTNILFIFGRTGMLQFLNGRDGLLCRNGQRGEFVTSFDVFTNSTYVPPSDLHPTNHTIRHIDRIDSQSYVITPVLLDVGAAFRMQVTNTAYLNTAYSSYSVIPMGQADLRIRDGETLVIASPNMATGETNRLVAFFTPTVFIPPEIPVPSDDKLPDPGSIPPQPKTSTPSR